MKEIHSSPGIMDQHIAELNPSDYNLLAQTACGSRLDSNRRNYWRGDLVGLRVEEGKRVFAVISFRFAPVTARNWTLWELDVNMLWEVSFSETRTCWALM